MILVNSNLVYPEEKLEGIYFNFNKFIGQIRRLKRIKRIDLFENQFCLNVFLF